MKTRELTPAPRLGPRRRSRVPTERPEVSRFQGWQRRMPPQTALLVRLVRVLAH